MTRIHTIAELSERQQDLYLAMGVFDGVHVGHQAVIGAAVSRARENGGVAGVLTFDPHPIQVLAPDRAPRGILASLDHKERILASIGVEVLVVLSFSEDFARQTAEQFAEALLNVPQLRFLCAGADWRFGQGRSGTMEYLRERGAAVAVEVEALDAVKWMEERVSSTRIRQALRDGNLKAVNAMLGRPYTVLGRVVRGQQLGRQLGVPTANIEVGSEQLPPDGVYAVSVLAGDEWLPGVSNLGVRPTVDGVRRLLEVHLLDFDGDLYGQELEVQFGRHLRTEMKFANVDELKEQMHRDVERAQSLFEEGVALGPGGARN